MGSNPTADTNLLADRNNPVAEQLRWSSGYDVRLTRERSPVRSRDEVDFVHIGAMKIMPPVRIELTTLGL